MNKFKSALGIFAFSLLLLSAMPATASAQYGDILEGIFGGSNNRNNRNDRNNGTYNRRSVESAIDRVKSRADNFRSVLDDALDDSRIDGRRGEDNILNTARNFERAADRLDDRFDDRRRSNRNNGAVNNLLQIGSQLDNFVYSQGRRLDRRVQSEWSAIRSDLQIIANAYGYNFGGYNNRRNRNDDVYNDDRDDDDRDDDYRNNRRNRRNNDNRRNRSNFPF